MSEYGEKQIEADVQAAGLTAPRVTPGSIEGKIVRAQYHVFEGTTVTVCALETANGYVVVGKSAAASPENFQRQLGEKIAYADAWDQLWALEGYLLREKLAQAHGADHGALRYRGVP